MKTGRERAGEVIISESEGLKKLADGEVATVPIIELFEPPLLGAQSYRYPVSSGQGASRWFPTKC